jgi:hypothetical protein
MVLKWEEIKCELMAKSFFGTGVSPMLRAKVPGGWFIQVAGTTGNNGFFYPDPEHLWDGSSLP